MEKECKLFDKRFVHFMWDDELEGKQVFVADDMNFLIECVEKGTATHTVQYSRNMRMPFKRDDFVCYRFAYYDPNYEVKKAFNEGKKLQFRVKGFVDWEDYTNQIPCWDDKDREWRIKPEATRWVVYLNRPKNRACFLDACREDDWEIAQQEEYGAKTKLFIGTGDEAVKWYESREKFTEIIKAWEDGKTIQVYETLFKKWSDCAGTLEWYTDCEYRVKPEEWCVYQTVASGYELVLYKQCFKDQVVFVGTKEECEKWIANHPFKPDCTCEEKTFRPFKDCDELVKFWSKNYQTGFRPANTKPLIWVRLKCDGRERLIVAFGKGFGTDFVEVGNKAMAVPLQRLFDDYEFLDGNPCGMEVKE